MLHFYYFSISSFLCEVSVIYHGTDIFSSRTGSVGPDSYLAAREIATGSTQKHVFPMNYKKRCTVQWFAHQSTEAAVSSL